MKKRIIYIVLATLCLNFNLKAQEKITIYGVVLDSISSKPIIGATVKVINSKILTQTDASGKFSLSITADQSKLQISTIGFKSRMVEWEKSQNHSLQILLSSDLSVLKEVMVISTGYQSLSKERINGSVVQINNELLNRSTGANILDRLNGITSGLRFNGTNYGNIATGAGDRQLGINIRGESTLSSNVSRDPLIVLDNFPYEGNINNINPNDIESISVLKDAAAASIWGSRSGNGVIVITTKKGVKNKPLAIDFSANVTVRRKPNLFADRNYLPSNDYINVETALFKKGYFDSFLSDAQDQLPVSPVVDILDKERQGLISSSTANSQIDAFRQKDVRNDYTRYLYQNAVKQQYSLGLRGGSEHNSYTFSAGFDRNHDNLVRNGFDRLTINALNFYNPIKNLEITTGINYSDNTTALNNNLGYAGSLNVGGPITGIYPYAEFASASGTHLPIVKDYRAAYANNAVANGFTDWNYRPLDELNNADNTTKVNDLLLKASVKYNITNYLNAEAQYQNERQIVDTRNYQNSATYAARNFYNQFTIVDPATNVATYQAPKGGLLNLGNYELLSQNARLQINFHQLLAGSHEITALAGSEIRQLKSTGSSKSALGYDDQFGTAPSNLDYANYFPISPNGYANFPTPNDAVSGTLNRYVSYFANVTYSFNDKYALTLSGRKDGANIFGVKTNDRVTPLWSAGLGWEINKEAFYQIDWLPYLKGRFSYGYNGNVYNGSAYVTGNYGNSSLTGAQQIANLTAPNPELRWEKVKNINIGIDFSTKNNRISGTIEYYVKEGKDLVENIPLFTSTGFLSFYGNAASTKSRGFDITVNSKNLNGKLKWNTILLFSTLHDKVTKYDAPFTNISIQQGGSQGIPSVGKSLYGIYSYKWFGLDPANGDPQGYLNGKISKDYTAIINNYKPDSLVYNGSARPTIFGSLRNEFSYWNIFFSANIGYEFGYVFRRGSTSISESDLISANYGQNVDYSTRWQKSGDEAHTNIPSVIYPSDPNRNTFYHYSQTLVSNAANIRILDLRVGYNLNKTNWRTMPFNSLQIFCYATNLGIVWRANKYNIDPDLSAFQSHALPNPLSISLGVNGHF
ncbi:SusC/RagA family TonB-linked outer membrane protein [Mucilaginibacter lappiensis]|uniref:SusC/RagA family TonB-linked outer membrane protein n=1 Tax=Mucilaginibacter lappiensis TaxID=354630 RepID=UPI003D2182EB